MSQPHAPQSRPRRHHPPETWAALEAGWTDGQSPAALSRRHGVALSTLKERAAREGWVRAPVAPPPLPADDLQNEDLPEDAAVLARAAWRHAARAVMAGDRLEARAWTRLSQDLRAVAEADADRERKLALDLYDEYLPVETALKAEGVEAVRLTEVRPRPGHRRRNVLDIALAQAEAVTWAKLNLDFARKADAADARPIDLALADDLRSDIAEARFGGAAPTDDPDDGTRREVKSARPRVPATAAPSAPAPAALAASPAFPADPADPADFSQRPEPASPPPALPGEGRGPSLRKARVRRGSTSPIPGPRPSPGRAGGEGPALAQGPEASHPQPPAEPHSALPSPPPPWTAFIARPEATLAPAERVQRMRVNDHSLHALWDRDRPLALRRWTGWLEQFGMDSDRVQHPPPPPALCVPDATPTSGPRVRLV